MSFTVTVTQTGGTAASAGTYLAVRVITGQAASQPGITGTAAALTGTVTPTGTGSWVFGSLLAVSGALTAQSGTTILDTTHETANDGLAHAPVRTTGTTTSGTPVTVGASAGGTHVTISLAEILASGTLAQDASTPATVYTSGVSGKAATTAAFTPPNGSLLVAIVSTNGAAGVNSVSIADTSGQGLTWTEIVHDAPSAAGYSGIWIAPFPQTGPPSPVGNPSGGPWTLAFQDEFTTAYPTKYGTGANPAVWADHFNNGDAQRTNNTDELEWYPHGYYGQSVSGSVLSLTATFQNPQAIDPSCPNPLTAGGQTGTFTSGMISSQPGFAATYGYWEALAQNPGQSTSPGTWPAFWGITRDVAYPPEIDTDEYNVPGHTGSVHSGYRNTAGTWAEVFTAGVDTNYHTWGMRLDASHVTFFLDGVQISQQTYDGNAYAWNTYFNHAVSTAATSGSGYPASYNIDYFRFWVVSGVPAQPLITGISPASGVPSSGSVTVSFAAVSGATSYRVTPAPTDYLADGIARPSHSSFTGASSPITVTGLTNGARYNFTVAGINATGYGIESLPVPSLGPTPGLLMGTAIV